MTFLETNRLRLRNVSPKDAIQMVDYRNNERCSKYQRGQTKDYKDIVALIERNKDNALNIASPTMISVALRETDVMIGEIVVMPNEGTISLGYTFSYKVHRSGYAYEALSSLIEYLHKHYPQWDFICFTERIFSILSSCLSYPIKSELQPGKCFFGCFFLFLQKYRIPWQGHRICDIPFTYCLLLFTYYLNK